MYSVLALIFALGINIGTLRLCYVSSKTGEVNNVRLQYVLFSLLLIRIYKINSTFITNYYEKNFIVYLNVIKLLLY